VVVGLDQAGQRAAFAERGHVAGGADRAHRRRRRGQGGLGRRHRPASPVASIASAAFATPFRAWISAPPRAIRPRRSASARSRSIASRRSSSAKAYVGSRTPNPVSSTRWALWYWSQNRGRTTIGLPKWKASV